MNTEIEAKFLDINPEDLRAKLKAASARLEQPERLMRRHIFDYPDGRLEASGGWVRVRDEGDKITLSYKQLQDRTLHGTKEVVINVDDYAQTKLFLESIGLASKSYQETRRESWRLGDAEVTIDIWPWIPPLVEIEGTSEVAVRYAASELDLDWDKALHGSVETAYQALYDFTEAEINAWKVITFTPKPDWLLARAK